MNRKPKSKLPAGWEVYSSANRKPVRRRTIALWKYGVWAVVLIVLAAFAFFPELIIERL